MSTSAEEPINSTTQTDVGGESKMDTKDAVAIASLFISLISFIVTAHFLGKNYDASSESNRRTIRSNSAKMLVDLASQYDSPDMRKHRIDFAQRILELKKGKRMFGKNPYPAMDIFLYSTVLDFLDDVSYLTNTNVLDKRLVKSRFGNAIVAYHFHLTNPNDYLLVARSVYGQDKWVEFEKLALAYRADFEKDQLKEAVRNMGLEGWNSQIFLDFFLFREADPDFIKPKMFEDSNPEHETQKDGATEIGGDK